MLKISADTSTVELIRTLPEVFNNDSKICFPNQGNPCPNTPSFALKCVFNVSIAFYEFKSCSCRCSCSCSCSCCDLFQIRTKSHINSMDGASRKQSRKLLVDKSL